MIYLYHADSERFQKEHELNKLLEELPKNMHERALRYHFKRDAYNYVLGRLLLKKGLTAIGLDSQFQNISFQKDGKPTIEGAHFSISHSDNLVVCVISIEGIIGIDVEKEKQINLENFKPWFTNIEWADINNAHYPIQKFYWYWTRKESIIKALGIKLSYLHKIELDARHDFFIENGEKWYLKDLDFAPGFFGSLCAEKEITKSFIVSEVRFIDIKKGLNI